MNEPLLVRGAEAARYSERDLEELPHRGASGAEEFSKGDTLHELLDEEANLDRVRTEGGRDLDLLLADVVDRDHVLVLDGRGGARLELEALHEPLVLHGVDRQDLDRDVAMEPHVASLPDRAHPSGLDGRDDLVGAEERSRFEDHGPFILEGSRSRGCAAFVLTA